jgi:hypothetical protein
VNTNPSRFVIRIITANATRRCCCEAMGGHPFIAAMIHARPPTTAVTPAKIPKFLASVGEVAKIAAVVKIAATVHSTAAIIL